MARHFPLFRQPSRRPSARGQRRAGIGSAAAAGERATDSANGSVTGAAVERCRLTCSSLLLCTQPLSFPCIMSVYRKSTKLKSFIGWLASSSPSGFFIRTHRLENDSQLRRQTRRTPGVRGCVGPKPADAAVEALTQWRRGRCRRTRR